MRQVGVVGYGTLGQFLVEKILNDPNLELSFVWNRSYDKVQNDPNIPDRAKLRNLDDFEKCGADVIVEVAHPIITRNYGPRFLQAADYMIGSPTALADPEIETSLREAASHHGLYIPAGALWGAEDIKKMADRGTLDGLSVVMKKHPSSLKADGGLEEKVSAVPDNEEVVVYDGPVRGICPLAPNNVNTMAAAALAGHSLGFDKTIGILIADTRLNEHIIEITAVGPKKPDGSRLEIRTVRINPAKPGAVTGQATYMSFYSSLLATGGRGKGVHFC